MNTLVVLSGPTGVGKTQLCLQLAEEFGIPIINADSRQIYAEIPIGTAAPTKEEQQRVNHYFVGTQHVGDYFSVSVYEQSVMKLLDKLFEEQKDKENRVALLSGGSMMYVDVVCHGIDDIPTVDDATRSMLKKRYEEEGLENLRNELKLLDPEYYAIVDLKNPKRVVHALEICYMTGKTYTSFRTNEKKKRPFNILRIGLVRDREELYDRINRRVDEMVAGGLVDEVKSVQHLRSENALNTVGYKEIFEYLDGNMTLDEAVERIKCNTRRYCRKQLTWLRRDKSIRWFHPDEAEDIIKYIYNNI